MSGMANQIGKPQTIIHAAEELDDEGEPVKGGGSTDRS
jgi:hypothetical protein